MKRILPLAVLAAGLAACIVGPAPAQQTPPPAEPARPAPTVRLIEPADLDRPLAPAEPAISFQRAALMDEIQAVLETGRAEVAALEAELDPAAGADAFLAQQKRIEARKARIERDVLAVQLVHAERAGRADSAARLRAALDALDEPPPAPAAPSVRDRDEGRAR